ncbi:MAG: exodeoxyribonuclease I [Gammaproteobacteria bacterium]|jgi:exodeoxyribonuclease-1|nr:exodeoxyribonuclease I [Gammaproteobacteria bacterium]MDC0464868.1 exodeoxyribonuclease I [Pseudomonadales bacterium]
MQSTFFWYDLETTGTDPILDRIVQFAGQRTDSDLRPIGPPVNFYIKPSVDTLFHPDATLITGIDPDQIDAEGLSELEGLRKILACFTEPNTCVVGYNNLNFDDEFVRQSSYRNFFDPYAREWQNGNSRWDLINLLRMTYALRPAGINWPKREDGKPSFTLVKMAEENGLSHENAHDALSDIEATISLAKLVKNVQPKLFEYHFKMRKKQPVLDLLYPLGKAPVLLVQPFFDPNDRYLAPILPLLAHPSNQNSVICLDLRQDPEAYCSLKGDALTDFLLPKRVKGEGSKPSVVQRIQINRCPPIAPMNTLPSALAVDLSWSHDALAGFVKKIQSHPGVQGALIETLRQVPEVSEKDAEFQLYGGGFVSEVDRSRFAWVHETASAPGQTEVFETARLNELLFTFKARHYPDSLDAAQVQRWRAFLSARWQRDARLSTLYQTTKARFAAQPDSVLLPKLLRRLQEQASLISLTLD